MCREIRLMSDQLLIAGRAFRLNAVIVGTGKYRSFQEMARAHTAASGADLVTVAVRRVNLTDRTKESLLDYIDRDENTFILPNTAGCYSADDAVRAAARLGREVGLSGSGTEA